MIPISDLLDDHELYHSEFQQDFAITVRAGGTPFGCYKQALRELWKRFRGLSGLYSQRARLAIDIEEADELAHDGQRSDRDRRRSAIDLAERRLSAVELDKSIEHTEREFLRFYAQAAAIKQSVGDLTPERRNQLDREMWEHRLMCQAAVGFMAGGRCPPNTLEMLHACPRDMRERVLALFPTEENPRGLIDWYLSYEPAIPAPLSLTDDESRKVLECCESSPSPAPLPNSSRAAASTSRLTSTGNGYSPASHAAIGMG